MMALMHPSDRWEFADFVRFVRTLLSAWQVRHTLSVVEARSFPGVLPADIERTPSLGGQRAVIPSRRPVKLSTTNTLQMTILVGRCRFAAPGPIGCGPTRSRLLHRNRKIPHV